MIIFAYIVWDLLHLLESNTCINYYLKKSKMEVYQFCPSAYSLYQYQ